MQIFIAYIALLLLVARANCLYSSTSNVVDLTPSNFDKLVINSDHVWVVEFYAPWCGHCKQLTPEYEKAANALKGVAKVGAVNADTHNSLGSRFGVKGFPTLKIFTPKNNKPDDYEGERTATGMVDAALNAASKMVRAKLGGKKGSSESKSSKDSKDVIELTDDNFEKLVLNSEDMWLVEFYAPWCGHCKNLAPVWASAATELKGRVKLGALDATVHTAIASQYEIRGYPTIKYFAPGAKSSDSVEEYNGGRTSSDIVNWAVDKLSENIPAPEVTEIVNEKSVNCEDKPLCVVAVLPHILDCQSDCRSNYLETLKSLADKYKKKMWGWVWSEAGAQPEIEQALEIGGFGYPALAAVNMKKMKYSLLKGSFSHDGINEFLRDLSYGRGGIAPLKPATFPKIYETVPWDGKDAQPPQEEEIDLSDVDLDEKYEL